MHAIGADAISAEPSDCLLMFGLQTGGGYVEGENVAIEYRHLFIFDCLPLIETFIRSVGW